MALSLLIFDCDGVILESVDAKTRAFLRVGSLYGDDAGKKLREYHLAHGGVNRLIKFEWFFDNVLQRKPEPGEAERLACLFSEYSTDEVLKAQLVPGILDVLQKWEGKVPMTVASGAPQKELEQALEEHDLTVYFSKIYGSPPGKTDLLRKILAETGLSPAETVMIGDSGTDMYAAEAVHCLFYGRGEYFRSSEYPWYEDLTQLNAYLDEL